MDTDLTQQEVNKIRELLDEFEDAKNVTDLHTAAHKLNLR